MAISLFLKRLRDILLLPFNVTVIIPCVLYYSFDKFQNLNLYHPIPGILFIASGLLMLAWTISLFHTFGHGTLAPWEATKKLVIRGPYKYVRNPMIMGVLLVLIGETLLFNSVAIGFWFLSFTMISTLYFKYIEEPALEKRFGNPYTEYKKGVNRWIPKIKAYNKPNDKK